MLKKMLALPPVLATISAEVEMTTIYMTTYRRQNYHGSKDRDPYKKPVSHGPAPVVPYSNAPAVRVQNLKRLQSVCGTEELATKLGVSLGRLELMLSGVNFSDEMAYHSEQSLGLTPGFLDKPGAVLTEAEKDFLLKPFVEESPEEPVVVKLARPASEAQLPAQPAAKAATPEPREAASAPADASAHEAEQAKSGAPPDSQTPLIDASSALSYPSPDTLSKEPSMSADPQLTPQESPEAQLRKVRQENLKLLAEPKGVKSRMVLLTGLSPANLSHRLHGHKIFDAETGDFFCEKLGLPRGWFEAPRTAADIPLEVSQRLNGTIPGLMPAPALKQPRSISKTAMTKPAGTPLAKTKAQKTAKTAEQAAAGPSLSLSAAALGLTAAEAAAAAAPTPSAVPVVAKRVRVAQKPAAPASAPSAAPMMAQSTNTAVLERPVQAPVQQQQAAVAPVNVGTPAAAALPLASADAGPLAQACLAVLTVKIQAGRLPEQKAMELLGVFANL